MVGMDQQLAERNELRERVDSMARGKHEPSSRELEALSPEATRQLIHDLRSHQIELEMQNNELRCTQLALSASNARYLDLYDFAPVGYCTVNDAGIIQQANLSVASLLGRDRETLIEQPIRKFILGKDQDIYYLHHKRLLATGAVQSCELRLVKSDGKTVWVCLTSTTTEDAEEYQAHRIVLSDITERKQRDDILRLQALVLDQIQDHVTITDLDGIVTYVNKINGRQHDLHSDGMMGRHVSEYGDGPLADATQQEIVNATLTKGAWHGKVVNFLRDGSYLLADLRTSLVRDDEGNPVAMMGVGTDITERYRLEEALRQREVLSSDIINSLDDEIAVLDRNGVILAINEQWRRFSFANGIDPGSLTPAMDVGANYLAVCNSSSSIDFNALNLRKNILAVLERTLPSFRVDYPCHSPTQERWFQMSVMPLGSSIGGVVIAHRNITAQKKSEAALTAALCETERANNSKSRFLAAASHDLRQPLSAMSLYVDVLKARASPSNRKLVNSIQDCVVSMSGLLTDLLDISKLDAGVIIPKPSWFSLDELLNSLASIYTAEAELKGLRLRLRPGSAIVRGDKTLLRRLLGNLIANAISFTHSGGVLIACRRHQRKLWVEVWDSGIGIAEDQLGTIFEEYRKIDDESRTRGSGLGLAIVDKMAKLLGLQLRVRSRPGRGSVFAIELPEDEMPESVSASPRSATKRLRIALVDDNSELLAALVMALEGTGHEVLGAASGSELFARLGNKAPDIVISDYRLASKETGFDVIKAARDLFGQDLPAFLITGDTDPALIRPMADRGIAIHYKPFQIDALQAFISNATGQQEL